MIDYISVQEKLGIIGKSKAIKDLIDIILQVAESDITVLLYGESGTGKEVFANAIHSLSKRKNKELTSVNCGAIPEGILEDELFGHVKGAYTGAGDSRKGYFEIADKGSLFLDEIGEMPLKTQVKLLRVLETGDLWRLGSEKPVRVDVRIIAATNRNLQEDVNSKKFRKDLYFRIKAVTLTIPPLRERPEDILPLASHFLAQFVKRNNYPHFVISNEAEKLLLQYNFPGNIRELKNIIETSAALSKDAVIKPEQFEGQFTPGIGNPFGKNLPVNFREPDFNDQQNFNSKVILGALYSLKRDIDSIKDDVNFLKKLASENLNSENNYSKNLEEVIPLEQLEIDAIKNALLFTKGNKRRAAQLLNISERTLYRKLNFYEIGTKNFY